MILILVTGVVGLSTLSAPAPFVDEAWYAARALGFIETGRAFGTLDRGVVEDFEGYWTWYPVPVTAIQAVPVWLFGPTIFSIRLPSMISGLALIVAMYAVGCQVAGRGAGLLAAALVAWSRPFLYSSHLGRQDIVVAALGMGALALMLARPRKGEGWCNVAAGLLVAVAMETHLNAAVYGVLALAVVLHRFGLKSPLRSQPWCFAAGLALGTAGYVAAHVLPYPAAFVAINMLLYSTSHSPPIARWDAEVWIESFLSTMQTYLYGSDFRLLIAAPSLAAAAIGRARGLRLAVLLFVAMLVAQIALIRNHLQYYVILQSPLTDLLVAVAVSGLFRARFADSLWPRRLLFGATCLLVWSVFSVVRPVFVDARPDYEAALSRVSGNIAPEATIMGAQAFWFALQDHTFLGWQQLALHRHQHHGASLDSAMERFRPDYLLIDRQMRDFVGELGGGQNSYTEYLLLPAGELRAFLASRGELVDEFESASLGLVSVYRIRWQ
ncbi:MAG: glycosyltransferase family 39 protein [Chloroflexota bacterium]